MKKQFLEVVAFLTTIAPAMGANVAYCDELLEWAESIDVNDPNDVENEIPMWLESWHEDYEYQIWG